MRRKIYRELLDWKKRPHKSLIIKGQRQIGKTFIIRQFGESEYTNMVYINFDDSPDCKELFEGDRTAEELIRRLSLRFGTGSVTEGSTLLFLDEIQECPAAYASIKQFTIYGKLDVVASGLLLGLAFPGTENTQTPLIPMGYEETIQMYSMDFEEFLWAMNFPEEAISEIKRGIRERTPIDTTVYKRAEQLFREYMIVGGMPEAVEKYSKTKDFRPADTVQSEIVGTCIRDINRYNSGIDRIKTQECFESIPDQLADSNKKFMFSRIKGEGSRRASDRYAENLLWIEDAGYGNFCYGLEAPALPLRKYLKRDSFKVYLSDTGLLMHMYGDKAKAALYGNNLSYNMGAVAENAVAEALMKNGIRPSYYRKDKGKGRMELDFVLEFWEGVAAIEVKSGKDRSAPSLSVAGKRHNIARRIMLERWDGKEDNIRTDQDGIEHYPLFACSFIREMDPQPEGPRFS